MAKELDIKELLRKIETEQTKKIIDTILPHATYYVGGCVRDAILNRPIIDIDMATAAPYEEAKTALQAASIDFVEGGYGSLRIGDVELTSFREDGEYTDNRHPDEIHHTTDIKKDCLRRDFTMGAIYLNQEELFDPLDGITDIQNGIIRSIGDPKKSFSDDPLRILRALRFEATLGFDLDPKTEQAMHQCAKGVSTLSGERITKELFGLLVGDFALQVLIERSEALAEIIPEIKDAATCPQHTKYHSYNVWEHTARSVVAAPKDKVLRLALMLHDLGKPACRTRDKDGVDHFAGHAAFGAEIAKRVVKRLSLPSAMGEEIVSLIAMHRARSPSTAVDAARLINKLGRDSARRLAELMAADDMAKSPQYMAPWQSEHFAKLFDEVESKAIPTKPQELDITGQDVSFAGFKGREIGIALSILLEKVWQGELLNQRSALMGELDKLDITDRLKEHK